jgi:hypothetical protein
MQVAGATATPVSSILTATCAILSSSTEAACCEDGDQTLQIVALTIIAELN